MKKKTLLFLFALLSTLTASAYDAEIGGIYYNFDYETRKAKVTSGISEYTGSVTIPSSVTYRGSSYSVAAVGDSAFYRCYDLTSVSIPKTVTSIDSCAFYYCTGLKSITIPNSVTTIGYSAFRYCSGLTSVTIPNSVTSIGKHAFEKCSSLTSVEIPNSVTSIADYAFYSCTSLTSVTIPNSVSSMGENVFRNCYGLTSINIGNSVTSIGEEAFEHCTSLKSITIGNSVTSIGGQAFYDCPSLISITIPNSVTLIEEEAFCNCSSLTSVTIGSGVTEIGSSAFKKCVDLTEVYCYAENVPSTNSKAFAESNIENATLYVPEVSVSAYQSTEPWSGFGTIMTLSGETPVIPETPKCATPTISLVDGKLQFDCETEGVEYVFTATPPSGISGSGNDIYLSTKYVVTVYATKKGYDNSDVATKEIEVGGGEAGIRGDVNLDGEIGMPDVMFIVNYILNGKFPDE